MQDVACAAGVGMGTMYRRFGDRAGLTFALLSERHRAFQEQLLRGAPPLGPGAPAARAAARLRARAPSSCSTATRRCSRPPPRRAPRARRPERLLPHSTSTLLLREAAPAIDVEYAVETLMWPSTRACTCTCARSAASRSSGSRTAGARCSTAGWPRARERPALRFAAMSPTWIWMQAAIVVFVLAGAVDRDRKTGVADRETARRRGYDPRALVQRPREKARVRLDRRGNRWLGYGP